MGDWVERPLTYLRSWKKNPRGPIISAARHELLIGGLSGELTESD